MKKDIPLAAIIAVGVVLLIGIGFGVKAMFFQDPNYTSMTPGSAEMKQSDEIRKNSAINTLKADSSGNAGQSSGGGVYRH